MQPVDGHVQQDRLVAQDLDLLPNHVIEVVERAEGHLGREAGRVGDPRPKRFLVRAREAALGVRDHHDLACPQDLLADHERADRVLRCERPGVPDDVRVADPEAEGVLDIDAGVHARQDREARQRRGGQRRPVERLDEPLVLLEDPLELALELPVVHHHQ